MSTVLQQIATEKSWSAQDVDGDINILNQNRIFQVSDLRILSQESWTVKYYLQTRKKYSFFFSIANPTTPSCQGFTKVRYYFE